MKNNSAVGWPTLSHAAVRFYCWVRIGSRGASSGAGSGAVRVP